MNERVSNERRAEDLAKQLGIVYQFIRHSESGSSTEDASKALAEAPSHILKCLILHDKKSRIFIGTINTDL